VKSNAHDGKFRPWALVLLLFMFVSGMFAKIASEMQLPELAVVRCSAYVFTLV
jgi:hypothetical protein